MLKQFKNVLLLIALLLVFLSACQQAPTATVTDPSLPAGWHETEIVLAGFEKPQKVIYESVNGYAMFEGDIILGQVDAQGNLIKSDLQTQGIIRDDGRWFNGIIPFTINSNVTTAGVTNIISAIAHWEQKTTIDFVQIPSSPTPTGDYVEFIRGSSANSCSSWVGRVGGRQEIQLTSSGDCNRGTLIHEIGHAVGLFHEQSREDRNNHVTIMTANIEPGREFNFNQVINNATDVGPYDFGSIMHYGAFDFCRKNASGGCVGPTIVTKPAGIAIGQRNGLSVGDIGAVRRLYSFLTGFRLEYFCVSSEVCATGDVNGDGRDDLIAFARDTWTGTARGDVWVAFSNGSGFNTGVKVHDFFCVGAEICKLGDVNGDGRDDLITFIRSAGGTGTSQGDVYVAFSTGSGFGPGIKVHDFFCVSSEVCELGDVNGDGRVDLIAFARDTWTGTARGDVWVAFSNGSSFNPGVKVHDFFCIGAEVCKVGDMNGDNRADLVTFVRDTKTGTGQGDVIVTYSTGSGFGAGVLKHNFFCIGAEVCDIGDFNGDGRDDLVTFVRDTKTGIGRGDVIFAFSKGTTLAHRFGAGLKLHEYFCVSTEVCGVGDFNGDGKSELVTFVRDSSGTGTPRGDVHTALSLIPTNLSRFE